MTCPLCKATDTRRSRRRSSKDYLLSLVGLVPWRCKGCDARFYAMVVSPKDHFYAYCSVCGNMDLKPVARERVPGRLARIGRRLRLRAVRCEPCRNSFFTIRPLRRKADPTPASSGN